MKKFGPTILLAAITLLFTVAVKLIDVGPIGPQGSMVGFSGINGAVFGFFGSNLIWDEITNVIMLAVFSCGVVFAIIGLIQLIQRKKILKVDWEILMLGITYVLLGVLYVVFEKIIINYRPILVDGELAASFPSSHMMMVTTVGLTLVLILPKYIENKAWLTVLRAMLIVAVMMMIFGRLLSGMHWATDIMAGVLYSVTLTSLYVNLCKFKKGTK